MITWELNVPVQLNICELRSNIIRPHATFIRIFAEKLSFEYMCYFTNLQNLIEIHKIGGYVLLLEL